MSFKVLLYHELRPKKMLNEGQSSPIDVKQDYDDNLPAVLFNTVESFEYQMQYLKDNNYHTLTLSEVYGYYYENKEVPEKSILLTFDDCFQSLGQYAYPILKKHSFTATVFVVTGWLNDRKNPFSPDKSVCMTEKELAQMGDVFEYANHTHSFHTRENETTSMMMTASENELAKDIALCNDNPLIKAKYVFAYPFGLYSEQNVSCLRETGFHLAFTCIPGENNKSDDPLLLKRNVIPYFMDIEAFRNLIG